MKQLKLNSSKGVDLDAGIDERKTKKEANPRVAFAIGSLLSDVKRHASQFLQAEIEIS